MALHIRANILTALLLMQFINEFNESGGKVFFGYPRQFLPVARRGEDFEIQFVSGESFRMVQNHGIEVFFSQLIKNAESQQLLIALIESAVLFMLTILALWSAIGFFRLWRIAWTAAMFVQGASLMTSLTLYFLSKPLHITFLMISGIFMVLYLNYADIQTIFTSTPGSMMGETKQ